MAEKKKRPITVTVMGVSAKADPDALDDYDLFEVIAEYGATSPQANIAAGKALFGADGWKGITDSLRDKDGKLPLSRVAEFLNEATVQIEALKN